MPKNCNHSLATKMNLFVAVSRVSSVQLAEHVFATQSLAARTICCSVTGICCCTFNRSAMARRSLLVCRSMWRPLWSRSIRSQRNLRRSSAKRPVLYSHTALLRFISSLNIWLTPWGEFEFSQVCELCGHHRKQRAERKGLNGSCQHNRYLNISEIMWSTT